MWIFEKSRVQLAISRQGLPARGAASRFRVLIVSFLVPCFLLPTPDSLLHARGRYEVTEVRPQVFVWVPEDIIDQRGDPLYSRAATVGFMIADDGVVVVNTANSPFRAREALFEIRRRTELPVVYVINTCGDPDQTLGNEVFPKAAILSTAEAREQMLGYQAELQQRLRGDGWWRLEARMRGIHPTPSTQTFGEELRLTLSGREVVVRRISGGHSPGDAVVYLPDAQVAFLGHLFENGFFPRMTSANIRRWIEVLRELESWDVEWYVPAHGAPGRKKDVAEFRGFLEWLAGEVEGRVKEGQPLARIRRELNPAATFAWRARDLARDAVEAVYRQFVKPPDPAAAFQKP
jgi:glyoxylase-like metal-dependent hydrolase (beta-lactamase superfamily II)